MSELESRALAAYQRIRPVNEIKQQPGDVREVRRRGEHYVELSNINGVFARYRVSKAERLSRTT